MFFDPESTSGFIVLVFALIGLICTVLLIGSYIAYKLDKRPVDSDDVFDHRGNP